MDISEARAEIAAIDREMAALFERRMEAAESIAAWKQERGLPVLDRAQEERVLERNTPLVGDREKREFYRQFLKNMMRLSRQYQERLIAGSQAARVECPLTREAS